MKLDWIQGLRGVAVLLVVLTHGRIFLEGTPDAPLANAIFLPGAMGVDLFFLISGFIMLYTTRHASGAREALLFAIKRFARIWPAFAVITVLFIFVRDENASFFRDSHNLRALARTLAFLPVPGGTAPFFNQAFPLGWTLVFEMYFYIVFGLSMLAGRLRWVALAAWAVFSLVALPHMLPGAGPLYLQVVTHPIIYEFLAGVVIGMLYLSPHVRFPTAAVAWQAVVCASGFALWYAWSGNSSGHGPQGYGWPLALMLCSLALASKTVTLTVPRGLLWIGTVSYSMYLTHFLVQSWLTHWLEQHGMPFRNWNLVFLMLLLAIPVASLSHVLLEIKLGEWVRKLLMRAAGEKLAQPDSHVIKMPKVAS